MAGYINRECFRHIQLTKISISFYGFFAGEFAFRDTLALPLPDGL